jgi:hypothetical protein
MWPAGVLQSMSPRHQFSVEVMLASAGEVLECLLDMAVFHFQVLAEPPDQSLVSRTKRPLVLPVEKACGDTRLAPPSAGLSFSSQSHWSNPTMAHSHLQSPA